MDKIKLQQAKAWTEKELAVCADFWLRNGMDREHGGVYTCLDRYGRVYSTDKSVWMQGRCGWIFAYLCHVYGPKKEWLEASKSCLDFMEKYCINPDADGRMYFTVTADGKPLRQRRYYFSEAFYAIANAEYYGVTGDKECLEHAKRTGNKELVAKAEEIFNWAIKAGWDEEYQGLLYFVDCLGNPPEAYEHDMKLWWPHDEILISSLMLYRDTGKEEYLDWYFRTMDYCKKYFSDSDGGEWYGYLRRDGKPTEPSTKGSTFKGPFHLPRMLIMTDMMLKELLER